MIHYMNLYPEPFSKIKSGEEDIYDIEKKELVAVMDIVDEDEKAQRLNQEIQDLYSSYYHIDYKDQPVYFDEEQEKKDKDKMLSLLEELNDRLNEINDGSFEINDREMEKLEISDTKRILFF